MNKLFAVASSLLISTSAYALNFDASLGYFPVARETGGIFQVDARVLSSCCKDWNPVSTYGNWFAGVGLLGANRSNSFNTWISGSLGFQFKTIQAIQWVDIRPEVSWVYNGYTNPNSALAIGAQFLVQNPTTPLSGASVRWSLNGDVLVGVVFKPLGASCSRGSHASCSSSCQKSSPASCSTKIKATSDPVALDEPQDSSSDATPSTPTFNYRRLSVKIESPRFRDLRGRQGKAAVFRLARTGFFADDVTYLPAKTVSVKDYNAVMARLSRYLELSEFESVTQVPSSIQFQSVLRGILSAYVSDYPESNDIVSSLNSLPKASDTALSREKFAFILESQLSLIPNLLP